MSRRKLLGALTFCLFSTISHALDMTEPIRALRSATFGVASAAIPRPVAELCHAQSQALSDEGAKGRSTARKDADGAWRSEAAFSIHGQPGEWHWDASHKVPVRKSDQAGTRTGAAAAIGDLRKARRVG
jgi:hypothetical protein